MSALSIQPTYPIFTDTDGKPLEDGYIWIGVVNLHPIVNPITVYWDAALTIPAAQPIRTQGGYPVNNGTPARLYVNSDYSIRVVNKNGSTVYSAPAATERYSSLVITSLDATNVDFVQAGTGAVTRTAQSKMRDWIHVKDFGAVGDGVTDDTEAIQNALTAGANRTVLVNAGTYLCGKLRIHSGTKLVGEGTGNTVIRARPTLATTDALLTNFNAGVGVVDVYTDTDILVTGITFDGNNLGSRTAELIGIGKAQRVTFESCSVRNVRYIGLAHAGCRDVKIVNSYFDAIGEPTPQPVAGPALWFGSHLGSKNYNVLVQGNTIENCNEAGINAGANDIRIIANQIKNVKEAGIFVSSEFSNVQIIGNTIENVTSNNISSSGIECGATNVIISGNRIANINGGCIALTDAQQVVISGNLLFNPRRDAVKYPGASHIEIITISDSPNQPQDINITGNQAFSASPDAYAFVYAGNVGSPINDVLIADNNTFGLNFASGKGVVFEAGKMGTNVVIRNNSGCLGFDPVVGSVQNISSPGLQSITGIGFRPRTVEIYAVKASPTESVWSKTITPQVGNIRGTYSATSSAGHIASIAGNSVKLVNPSTGVNDVIGSIESFDQDGFTINFATTNYQAWLSWVAYP